MTEEYRAIKKYERTSPRKLREVADMVRGMSALDAVSSLKILKKAAATPLEKTISAALAAAREKGANPNKLVLENLQVGEGPRLKRFRAGARGRAKPYQRKMSHIRVVLTTGERREHGSKS